MTRRSVVQSSPATQLTQVWAGLLDRSFCCPQNHPSPSRRANWCCATWAVVLRGFAVLGYLNIVINAVPLLELDGYWFLADALDRPTLQHDARRALAVTLRGQPASRALAAYAASSLLFGLALIALGFAAWWHLFGGLFLTLWDGGVGCKILAAYLVLPFVPIVIHLVVQPLRYFLNPARPSEFSVPS